MAETAVPSGMTVQQWDDQYFQEYYNKNWFKKFMGTGSSSMIQVREDLTKKPGDSITFQLINNLSGSAKGATEDLEGQEEDLMLRSHKVTVQEYSHAVKWSNFEAQKTAIDLRSAHKDALMGWNRRLERDQIIAALMSIDGVLYGEATESQKDTWLANNSDRVLFGASKGNNSGNDHSAALANIDTTSDKLTPGAVSLMKRMAKTASPKITPFVPRGGIEDSDAYVLFVNSYAMRDLANDTTFVQANREARERGNSNPLFDSADYLWDNVYIYEIEDIPTIGAVGNSSAIVAPIFLCGAQALGEAWAMRPSTVARNDIDYERKNGLAIKQWSKIEKLRFGSGGSDTANPKQNGCVTGYFSAALDS